MKQTILTGLRTNDDYHIGNYMGAMLPIIEMAKKHSNEYDINMFIPDLHSFTTPIDHSTFYERSLRNLRVFFAAGLPLDDENVHVYRQSHVSAHAELTVILNNFAPFGQLSRMVEFKEKKDRFDEEFVSNLSQTCKRKTNLSSGIIGSGTTSKTEDVVTPRGCEGCSLERMSAVRIAQDAPSGRSVRSRGRLEPKGDEFLCNILLIFFQTDCNSLCFSWKKGGSIFVHQKLNE
jgi:hypothetical protein